MRFGFSEFSHHSPEVREVSRSETEQIRRLNETQSFLDEMLREQQDYITLENLRINTQELNKKQLGELNEISNSIRSLQSEISDLQRAEADLSVQARIMEVKLPKAKGFEEIKKTNSEHLLKTGTLEDAREKLRLLTIKKNNMQATVSDYRQALASHKAVQKEAIARNAKKFKIEQAQKAEDLKIAQQLHPSGKSAKDSAEVFVEHFNQEEALARSAKEQQIANAQFAQDAKIAQQLHPSGKSAKESAEVFAEHFNQVNNEAVARSAKEQKILDAQKLQDLKIEQQLHPSGKSAQESAEVFIEHFKNEAQAEAKPEIVNTVQTAGNEAGNGIKAGAGNSTVNSGGIKNTIKNAWNSFVNTIKTHKKTAAAITAIAAVLTAIIIFLKKHSKRNNQAEISNNSNVQNCAKMPSFDEFTSTLNK